MSDIDVSTTDLVLGLAGLLVMACYVALILVPAWRCYGRFWEKVGAGFLTLFILATLIGIGAAVGFAIVWSYDQYA
ncbi:MAG TPA: hypothetical protein VK307_03125 [Thermoleophilaceae bacterium]|nr:hypothetical protein [Thermoleophilaceae bacterium]